MRVIDEKTTVYRLYDSVQEQVDFAMSVPESRLEFRHGRHRFVHGEPTARRFVGRDFACWADVEQATRTAWPEGLEVLDRMVRDLDDAAIDQPKSRRRKMRFRDDDGDELDYDRLRSGQSYWRTSRRENTRGPATVTIVVDVAANCGTRHQDILWRGAAAIAMTEKLESAGYRVELWLSGRTDGVWSKNGQRFDRNGVTAACLKRPGDPLDSSTLISAVSGWFFRTVLFRSWCQGTWAIKGSLGHSRPPTEEDLDQITPDQKRIVIARAFTYQTAVDQVREKITQLTTT